MMLMIEAALRSLALGAVVWVVLRVTRVRNPYLEKMIWSLVVCASLAMPGLVRAHFGPLIQAPDYVLSLRATSDDAVPHSVGWLSFSMVYALVAAALATRFAYAVVTLWWIRREARVLDESSGVDVRISARIAGPATFGATILLPEQFTQWGEHKLRAVLSHERAHVANRDCYLLWLVWLHRCVFWLNPLAWWVQRRITLLAEITSDEAAVVEVGDPVTYAEILLEFAKCRVPSGASVAMARPRVSERIERVLAGVVSSGRPRFWRRALIAAALVPVAAAFAAPLQGDSGSGAGGAASEPSVKSFPDLKQYYPSEALHQGITGVVKIAVTLDRQGRPTDTHILSEEPADIGFGSAASAVAHVMTYDNPTGEPAQLSFKVKFEPLD